LLVFVQVANLINICICSPSIHLTPAAVSLKMFPNSVCQYLYTVFLRLHSFTAYHKLSLKKNIVGTPIQMSAPGHAIVFIWNASRIRCVDKHFIWIL